MTDEFSSAGAAELGLASRIQLQDMRTPVIWGAVWGVLQAASPIGFWWLPPATVYGLGLALIAAVYIGFGVADGRPKVIAVECVIAAAFVVIAAVAVNGPAWLLVVGLAGHGLKDAWQQRTRSSPTRDGGRPSVPPSTGLPPSSFLSRLRQALSSANHERLPAVPLPPDRPFQLPLSVAALRTRRLDGPPRPPARTALAGWRDPCPGTARTVPPGCGRR